MKKIVVIEQDIANPQVLSQAIKKHTQDGDQIVMFFGKRSGKTFLVEQFIKQMHEDFVANQGAFNQTGNVVAEKLIDDVVNRINPRFQSINQKREAFGIEPIKPMQSKTTKKKDRKIKLSAAEIQSGLDRVRHAERLIQLLPQGHEGRDSWLLNYGQGEEAQHLRNQRQLSFDSSTKSAHSTK